MHLKNDSRAQEGIRKWLMETKNGNLLTQASKQGVKYKKLMSIPIWVVNENREGNNCEILSRCYFKKMR